MIKANELRIGNWVEVQGRYIEVETIDDEGINCEISGGYYAGGHEIDYAGAFTNSYYNRCLISTNNSISIKPIPITPEILEKCGFMHEVIDDERHYNAGKIFFLHIEEDWYLFGFFDTFSAIKYLHQLQNLYFALTGEELEININ